MKSARLARPVVALVGAVTAAGLVSGVGFARSPLPAGPVRPGQDFGGLVNGRSSSVVVQMGCFGPVRPGQTGHPFARQTLGVFRPEALRVDGFTGTAARSIVAHFSDDLSIGVTFTSYGHAKAIPTSLTLPCSGTGTVVFSPQPSSSTSHSSTVQVQFVGQP
jgi:hypothetical protein